MSRSDLAFYIVIGLIFEPLCWSVMSLSGHETVGVQWVAAKATITTLDRALDSYKRDFGSFPLSLKALSTEHYLDQDVPADPWGRPYLYHNDGRGRPEIMSLGRDGKPGGKGRDQDISSLHPDEAVLLHPGPRVIAYGALGCSAGYPFLLWVLYRRPHKKSLTVG